MAKSEQAPAAFLAEKLVPALWVKKIGVQKEPSQLASAYMEVRVSMNKARQQPCPA